MTQSVAPFWMSRLGLTAFRNHRATVLEPDERPVVLVGDNGAGKTNILEAISLLTPGRGLRNVALSDLVQREFGTTEQHTPGPARVWGVAAQFETPLGRREVGTARDPMRADTTRERRLIKIDGMVEPTQHSLCEVVSIIWLTPQMDGLFRDSSSGRRRFLDRLVMAFDPEHTGHVQAYEQALRERARLLKNGQSDRAWLAVLEDTMARHAVAVTVARQDLVERLESMQGAGPFPRATVALDGQVEHWLSEHPAVVVEDYLRCALEDARDRDRGNGGASVGPHRSDLLVDHRAKSLPARFCSTGEQKALLVSLILAQARMIVWDRGVAPLLLLDEVVAHLDHDRRRALFSILLDLNCQAWMTGTDRKGFELLGHAAQWVTVRAGSATLSPERD